MKNETPGAVRKLDTVVSHMGDVSDQTRQSRISITASMTKKGPKSRSSRPPIRKFTPCRQKRIQREQSLPRFSAIQPIATGLKKKREKKYVIQIVS